MADHSTHSRLGERPTVVIDTLPPREFTIEQPVVTANSLSERRWSRSQKGVLWTLGVAIYGLTLANIFVWEDKENKEQLRKLEETKNSEQVITASSIPNFTPTTTTPLDFPPVNSTNSVAGISTTTTVISSTEAVGMNLSDASNTSSTMIPTDDQ